VLSCELVDLGSHDILLILELFGVLLDVILEHLLVLFGCFTHLSLESVCHGFLELLELFSEGFLMLFLEFLLECEGCLIEIFIESFNLLLHLFGVIILKLCYLVLHLLSMLFPESILIKSVGFLKFLLLLSHCLLVGFLSKSLHFIKFSIELLNCFFNMCVTLL